MNDTNSMMNHVDDTLVVLSKAENTDSFWKKVNSRYTDDFIANLKSTNAENYCETENTYAYLETKEITPNNKNKISLCFYGIVDLMELMNFPIAQYILSLCGQNIISGKLSEDTKSYSFDIQNPYPTNKMVPQWCEMTKHEDEPNIEYRNSYINFGRCDCIEILFPEKAFDLYFNKKLEVVLRGYFKVNNEWSKNKGTKTIDVYPNPKNNVYFELVNPTDSIDLEIETFGDEATIICLINGEEYKKININNLNAGFKFHRIKFTNHEQKYMNANENKYLTDEINKNTINFSKIDKISLVVLNCKITKIKQHFYNVYLKNLRTPLY